MNRIRIDVKIYPPLYPIKSEENPQPTKSGTNNVRKYHEVKMKSCSNSVNEHEILNSDRIACYELFWIWLGKMKFPFLVYFRSPFPFLSKINFEYACDCNFLCPTFFTRADWCLRPILQPCPHPVLAIAWQFNFLSHNEIANTNCCLQNGCWDLF